MYTYTYMCMYMYMYVYVYINIYIDILIFIFIFIFIYIYIYMYVGAVLRRHDHFKSPSAAVKKRPKMCIVTIITATAQEPGKQCNIKAQPSCQQPHHAIMSLGFCALAELFEQLALFVFSETSNRGALRSLMRA